MDCFVMLLISIPGVCVSVLIESTWYMVLLFSGVKL